MRLLGLNIRFSILCLSLCLTAVLPYPAQAQGTSDGTVEYKPVYPRNMHCGKISSLFGSMLDLDGSRRDAAHTGIDFGEFGDVVIAPADGVIGKIWPVNHGWGHDWNLLIFHTASDLNLPKGSTLYYTEFDHLQRKDMPNLKAGDRIAQGDPIGVVRHPGNNRRFHAEVHMEIYELPLAAHSDTEWHDDDGIRYWWNASADLIDPLDMLSKHMQHLADGRVKIRLYEPGLMSAKFRGFVYPLRCLDT